MSTIAINEVLQHHLTAFGNNDLDEILKDYTETFFLEEDKIKVHTLAFLNIKNDK